MKILKKSFSFTIMMLFLATSLLLLGNKTEVQAADVGVMPGPTTPYFMIINKNSGKALDLIGGDTASGARINQWAYDYNSANQRWAILPAVNNHFKMISYVSQKACSIVYGSVDNGAQLHDWDYSNSGDDQMWDFIDVGNGWFKIKNAKSGKMLEVENSSTANDGKVQQNADNGGQANQLWRLQAWGDYNIKASSGRYVCVKDKGSTNGSRIIQYDYENNPWFKWRFENVGDGLSKVSSLNALSRVISVNNTSTAAGAYLHLWDYNPSNAGDQKVKIIPQTDGKFKFYFAHDGQTWDVPGGQTGNNVEIDQYPDNSNAWQKFTLERVTDQGNGPTTPDPGNGSTNPQVSNPISSVAASSIPAATNNGALTFSLLNGTNGTYSDDKIYWAVFGVNPATGKWCYLDLNGNMIPLTSSLNDASGHLTKNNGNYANVFYTINQKKWVNLPKMDNARMYLSVGTPCYIKTFDNGYLQPDVNNVADANRDVYFDFVEFTINGTGYHGNTTRVDGFGFPIQHRLVNKAGNFDRTVGENESESRASLFTKYTSEVPAAFKELGTLQAPYRILPPWRGNGFKSGGAYQTYYDSYVNQIWSTYTNKDLTFKRGNDTYKGHVVGNDFVFSKNGGAYNIYIHGKPSTYNILAGAGNLVTGTADEQTVEYELCAALNRHIVDDPANWHNASSHYKAAPANYYSKFWHDHSIGGLSYGFCFDDSLAAYLDVNDPKGLIIRIGW